MPLAAAAAMVVAALVLLLSPVAAQESNDQVLLSTFEHTVVNNRVEVGLYHPFGREASAHGFTSGSAPDGYFLASIELDVAEVPTTPSDVTVALWSATSAASPRPDDEIAALTHSTGTWSTGINTFNAPPKTLLEADTTYIVSVSYSGEGTLPLGVSFSTSADDTSAAGWSMGQYLLKYGSEGWRLHSHQNIIFRFRVNGRPLANLPSEVRAFWTDSDTVRDNSQAVCESNEPFRAFWLPPVESRSETGAITYKIASEWDAEVTPSRGASNAIYTIENTKRNREDTEGDPENPELTGTVNIAGLSTLRIRVRGMFDDEWGDWSKTTTLFCNIGGL